MLPRSGDIKEKVVKPQEKTILTRENADEAAKVAGDWVVSPEGRKAIEAGFQRAREITERFREAHRIDPDILRIPTTL